MRLAYGKVIEHSVEWLAKKKKKQQKLLRRERKKNNNRMTMIQTKDVHYNEQPASHKSAEHTSLSDI